MIEELKIAETAEQIDSKPVWLEKLAREALYFWNVHIWPKLVDPRQHSDLHFAMKKIVKIEPGQRVIEVGANMPFWDEYSHEVEESGIFIAIDLYPQLQQRVARELRKIAKERGQTDVAEKLLTADAGKLPLADESVDVVLANNYNADSYKMLSEAKRVLVSGGRLGFSFRSFLSARISRKFCIEIGLQVGETKIIRADRGQTLGYAFVAMKA